MVLAAGSHLRLDANWVDYVLIAIYFVFVLGIGVMARRSVSSSIDFFLSGRALPAWVTGLAFISANLGAVEIMGMSANGAQFGIPTVHYFWVGAVPAMLFLGVVMMPFYYGSKVRSVPEFMRRRFGTGAHLVNALSFAVAQLLIAGINLYLLASIVNTMLGWNLYISLIVACPTSRSGVSQPRSTTRCCSSSSSWRLCSRSRSSACTGSAATAA
jgi:SSS family solute:Na+ symporter